MATAIHRAGWIYIPAASRGTYDELVSTGNLGLLRNSQLKSEIANVCDLRRDPPMGLAAA